VIQTAQDAGLRVPEDLSVVGFDDSPLAIRIRPPLTTVRQDVAAKGWAAVAALIAEIERAAAGHRPPTEGESAIGPIGRPAPPGLSSADSLLPTELVIRASTAPAPSS